MDGIASRIPAAWIVALAAVAPGAARAAVAPSAPPFDMQSVADRVHSLAVAGRSHAFVPASTSGENGRVAEAITASFRCVDRRWPGTHDV